MNTVYMYNKNNNRKPKSEAENLLAVAGVRYDVNCLVQILVSRLTQFPYWKIAAKRLRQKNKAKQQ